MQVVILLPQSYIKWVYKAPLYITLRIKTGMVGYFDPKRNFKQKFKNVFEGKINTVFSRIVSAESILFWVWPYVLVTVHETVETIQGRKVY